MKNKWDDMTLEDKLDELFPKGKCKERSKALVLFAFAEQDIRKAFKEGLKSGKVMGYAKCLLNINKLILKKHERTKRVFR